MDTFAVTTTSTDQEYIYKSNALIQKIRNSLSLKEQQIFYLLLKQIKKDDKTLQEHTFKMTQVLNTLKLADGKKAREAIENAVLHMRQTAFWYIDKDGTKQTIGVLTGAKISPDRKQITLKLDDALRPYLLQLDGKFTELPFRYITSGIKKRYTMPLFEYLRSYALLGLKKNYEGKVITPKDHRWTVKVSAAELREILNCIDKYPSWKEFRRTVINKAAKEIEEYTNIKIIAIQQETSIKNIDQVVFFCSFQGEKSQEEKIKSTNMTNEESDEEFEKKLVEDYAKYEDMLHENNLRELEDMDPFEREQFCPDYLNVRDE